jgi:stearoyl-CoA desaturase (Delta-9 desaturase)
MSDTTVDTTPEAKPPINWVTTILFSLTFLAAITVVPWYGFTHGFSAAAWIWFFVFLAANGFSITAGYHRLWAHRAYEAHWSVRLVFMIFGAMALQNSILIWATDHRRHHRFVDQNDGDPYSAKRGFWFSHIGWMLRYWKTGRNDFSNGKDLQADPIVMFQHRFYLPIVLVTNIGLPLLMGWLAGDLWGVFLLAGVLRLVLNHHFTFFINSLAHIWGTQPYNDNNTARDNPVLAFLTYGEGYHNFHHIFDRDYRNAVRWWQWDPTKWLIGTLAWMKLAGKLQRVPDVTIERARLAMQFKRAQAALDQGAQRPMPQLDALRERLAQEYESFQATLADWGKLRDQWYGAKRQQLLQRWEEASFRTHVREIVYRLRMQRRRMRLLTAQLQRQMQLQPA